MERKNNSSNNSGRIIWIIGWLFCLEFFYEPILIKSFWSFIVYLLYTLAFWPLLLGSTASTLINK